MKIGAYWAGLTMLQLAFNLHAKPLKLETSVIPLSIEKPDLRTVGELEFRGGLKIQSKKETFGGLSGLAISANGSFLRAVSDKDNWIRAQPVLDKRGNLVGLASAMMGPLIAPNGKPISRKEWNDAESLFRVPNGYVASFERIHRLMHYRGTRTPMASAGIPTLAPHRLEDGPPNKSIEAAVSLRDGRWVVFAENFPEAGTVISGWILQKQRWRPFDLVRTELFHPAGAALLPSGDVLLLERRFTFLGGFGSRLSIIPEKSFRPGAQLQGREIARIDPPLVDENFEGVAAFKNRKGETIVFIVSDDNFFPLQSTLLLMFRLIE
tara:strand:- start:8468 stop:9436 length:969 start_codon:yes stop_codon:yes gene_type:complete